MVIYMKDVYLRREDKEILHNIHWNVEKGQHAVVYGLNGAGKTALLNMLCAYYFPSEGNVEVCGHVFGQSILGDQLRQKISIVSAGLQDMLHKEDSAYEIVLSGAFSSIGLYEEVTDELRAKAKQILADLNALQFADRAYELLSQGEKQRAMLGRALMNEPELLILDEPATGFDFLAREQLLETVEQIAVMKNAPTIVYVTHHTEEILPIFKRALLLKDGKVFAQGATKELFEQRTLTDFFDLPVEVSWQNERPIISKKKCLLDL